MRVILASKSPRREQLLAKIVKNFEIIPSLAPEITSETDPARYATELARHKALDVSAQHGFAVENQTVVIGCDTVVDLDGAILGKPQSPAHAVQMLRALSGKTHKVHTGVCVVCGSLVHSFCETSAVTFRTLSDAEIQAYVAGGSAMDKAGAYGIQDTDFVVACDGSFDNVMGFPTERVQQLFNELKIF